MKFCCFVVGLCFFIVSCGKDNNNHVPTNTELITTSTWKYNEGGMDVNKDGTIDILFGPSVIPSCLADNVGTFYSDGNGKNDEGATKCNSTDPQSTNFSWAFKSNETILNISGSGILGITGDFKILALTDTKLSLSRDSTVTGLGSVALVVNLKH